MHHMITQWNLWYGDTLTSQHTFIHNTIAIDHYGVTRDDHIIYAKVSTFIIIIIVNINLII